MTDFLGLPNYLPNQEEFQRRCAQAVNALLNGKSNNVLNDDVTLVASTATTTVALSGGVLGEDSIILFEPTSANAATEKASGSMWVSSRSVASQTFSITHTNNAQTDRSFKVVIIGWYRYYCTSNFDKESQMADWLNTVAQPWDEQKEFLKTGFERAQSDVLDNPLQYFPDDTFINFSPETQTALESIFQRSTLGSPLSSIGQQQVADTLSGSYFDSDAFNNAVQATINSQLPSVTSGFELAGRTGSGAAQEAIARTIADAYAQQYGAERDRQMQALGLVPQLSALDYTDLNAALGVGQIYDAKAQEQLADQIARFEFEQQAPIDAINQYMGLIQGNYGGTTSTPNTSNKYAGAIGGALGGAATGATIGSAVPVIGTGVGAAIGGGLGALASLL